MNHTLVFIKLEALARRCPPLRVCVCGLSYTTAAHYSLKTALGWAP